MRLSILLLIFFSLHSLYSQEENNRQNIGFTLGYFGETFTHKGLNLGLEKQLSPSNKYQIILAINSGFYIHKRNNTSLFLRALWGQRINFKNGLFLENYLGLGYLHQFVSGGEVYEVLQNGAVVETKNSGDPKFMPSVSLGTGYHFPNSRFSFYFRPELFWKAPFNGYFLTHFALNTGVVFKLSPHE